MGVYSWTGLFILFCLHSTLIGQVIWKTLYNFFSLTIALFSRNMSIKMIAYLRTGVARASGLLHLGLPTTPLGLPTT